MTFLAIVDGGITTTEIDPGGGGSGGQGYLSADPFALPNANATITKAQSLWHSMPTGEQTADRNITISPVGFEDQEIIRITQYDGGPYTLTITNGGPGGGLGGGSFDFPRYTIQGYVLFKYDEASGDLQVYDFESPMLLPTPTGEILLRASGGDDTAALQAAITASPNSPLLLDAKAPYLISATVTVPSSARVRCADPGRHATIALTAWAPPAYSANDPSIAMLVAAAGIAGSGTTLSRIYRGNIALIEVASAAALALANDGTDVIRVYSSTASGSDWNGEGGSERFDVVGVKRVYGNFLVLQRPLYCMHANGALVRKVTPAADIQISGVRLEASGGSMPVGLRLEGVTDSQIYIDARGFSHGAVFARYGCARLRGEIVHDGECNAVLRQGGLHDSEGLTVRSTGNGARCHRHGTIGGLVHFDERNVRGAAQGHRLRNGCTGMYVRGTINTMIANVDVDDMDLRARVDRPIPLLFTVTTGTDVINLFPNNVGDSVETRETDRVMVKSASTYPTYSGGAGALAAQTVYAARDVTTSSCKLALTAGGTVLDMTGTGAGFGALVLAKYLVERSGNNLLCAQHDFELGYAVRFNTITGLTLPAPLTGGASGDIYYCTNVVAGVSFQVASTLANAIAGTAIALTTAGDGFTAVERARFEINTTLSRSGLVRVAAAGIEINDGNPSGPGPGPLRNLGLAMRDVNMNCCKVPDIFGNQGSIVVVDTLAFSAANVSITNMGRSDSLSAPPVDGHIFGAILGDNFDSTFTDWRLQGVEQGLIFVWGWNVCAFVGLIASGSDGQSNPGWFIRNGMCDPVAEPAALDIELVNCSVSGYAKLISAHLSTWFAPTASSWSRFRFSELRVGALDKQAQSYEEGICAKNLTGATRLYGDVSRISELIVGGIGYPSAIAVPDDSPDGNAVWVYDAVSGYAANDFGFLAMGSTMVTAKTADAIPVGSKVYSATGRADVGATPGLLGAFGIARSGKVAAVAGKISVKRP